MDMRSKISNELKVAMKAKDAQRLSTLRLINAAIKDLDIAKRADGGVVDDGDVLQILSKMVKQRQESVRAYEEGGRLELAEREREEITVLEGFLPRQLTKEEVNEAITDAIAQTQASSLRDMGKVMGALKGKYTGQIDFGAVGPMVKEKLA